MTSRHLPTLFVLTAMFVLSACDSSLADIEPEVHADLILEWRDYRLERLKAEDGFLNLAGLHWLTDGEMTFGSDASNDIRFPAVAAATIGVFELTDDGVLMRTADEADVRYEGVPVTSLFLSDDTTENPVTIRHRTLAWTIIKRAGRFAVRVRDFEHPLLTSFPPLDYFPISTDFRVEGTLKPYAEPKVVQVNTVIEGLGWEPESPGTVVFDMLGERFELEAYQSGERLFFVFGDRTNGDETYPAGRFLYAEAPDGEGGTVLDFNRAYSPPCAFNDFSTCPVATPRNRLKIPIPAGEKYVPDKSSETIAGR